MPPPIRRFNALLVEGVPGIGKSTVLDALVRRHLALVAAGKIRTLLHLCQAHTMGPLARAEDGGTLTLERNREHLDRFVGPLEWLHNGVEDQRQPSGLVVLDTLHLTQCLRLGYWRGRTSIRSISVSQRWDHSALETLVLDNDGRVGDVIEQAHGFWYSVDALESFQRPLSAMPAHELEALEKQFTDIA